MNLTGTTLSIDLSGYQPLDADLTALAAISVTGSFFYRSAADTWAAVTIGGNLSFSGGTLNVGIALGLGGAVPDIGDSVLHIQDNIQGAVHFQRTITTPAEYGIWMTSAGELLFADWNSIKGFRIKPTSGDIVVTSATASVSPTTGALTVAGGLGVNGKIYASDDITAGNIRTVPSLQNAFFGNGSGNLTATGGLNTAVGYSAMPALTSGSQNSGIGASALQGVTSGNDNTGVGYLAGYQIVGGHYNTGVGSVANQNLTGGHGNVAIGRQAGYVNQTGSYNIYIGYGAGGTAATNYAGSNNVLIGAGCAWTAGDGNNRLNIGNLLFGENLAINQNATRSIGNIGIGIDTWGTNAQHVLAIADGVAPGTSPVGMGQLYVENGALKFRGSSGTVTVLAPA